MISFIWKTSFSRPSRQTPSRSSFRAAIWSSSPGTPSLQSALAFQLTIIGEAVSHVSEDVRARHPSIPWVQIKGLRNVIVHRYRGIDWQEVWGVATNRVPVLRAPIAAVLAAEFPGAALES